MVRAAREGLLTVTDAYCRSVAETRSAPLPGAVLLAPLPVQAPLPTLYQRTGALLGWRCTGAALPMLALGWRRTPQAIARPPAGRPVSSESLPARPAA